MPPVFDFLIFMDIRLNGYYLLEHIDEPLRVQDNQTVQHRSFIKMNQNPLVMEKIQQRHKLLIIINFAHFRSNMFSSFERNPFVPLFNSGLNSLLVFQPFDRNNFFHLWKLFGNSKQFFTQACDLWTLEFKARFPIVHNKHIIIQEAFVRFGV